MWCCCRLLWYKEPTPEAVGDLESYLLGRIEVHKLIFMDSQETINALRPTIETALLGKASMTTAIKGMLEVSSIGRYLAYILRVILYRGSCDNIRCTSC